MWSLWKVKEYQDTKKLGSDLKIAQLELNCLCLLLFGEELWELWKRMESYWKVSWWKRRRSKSLWHRLWWIMEWLILSVIFILSFHRIVPNITCVIHQQENNYLKSHFINHQRGNITLILNNPWSPQSIDFLEKLILKHLLNLDINFFLLLE